MIPRIFETFARPETRSDDIIYHFPYYRRDNQIDDPLGTFTVTVTDFEFNVTQLRNAINEKIAEIEIAGYDSQWIIVNTHIYNFIEHHLQRQNSHFDCTGWVLDVNEITYYGTKFVSSDAMDIEGFIVA